MYSIRCFLFLGLLFYFIIHHCYVFGITLISRFFKNTCFSEKSIGYIIYIYITITKSGRLTPLNSNYWKAYFLSKKSLDQSTSFDWSRPSHVRQSAPLDWLCLLIGCCRVTWWQSAPLDWLRVGIVDVDESLYLLYIYIPLTIILRHYHYYYYY